MKQRGGSTAAALLLLSLFGACSQNKDSSGDKQLGASGGDSGVVLETGGASNPQNDGACEEFVGLKDCGTQSLTASKGPVNILLLLDKSGSMDGVPDQDSGLSLWDASRAAIETTLAEADASIAFGLDLFPYASGSAIPLNCAPDCCAMPEEQELLVPIEPGQQARDRILGQLASINPGGGTPTAAALQRAYDYYNSGAGKALVGKRFVLLATDGGPNCNTELSCELNQCTFNIDGQCHSADVNCCASNTAGCLDDTQSNEAIKKLRSIAVDTFVVGLSGSERYAAQLDVFAQLGGRALSGAKQAYFKVDAQGSAAGLTEVMREITAQLVQSCEIQLAEAPPDPELLNVAVDCEVVPRDDSSAQGGAAGAANQASAWSLDVSTEPPTARLRGSICATIEDTGVTRIDILKGCPTVR